MNARWQVLLIVLTALLALLLHAVVLPDPVALARPAWAAVLLGCWAYRSDQIGMMLPAWLTGLCLDVMFDATLGCHALALVVTIYLIYKLRGFLRVFPLWQATLLMAPVWAIYLFLLFWMDGATHHMADPTARWLPLASTTLLWPLAVIVARVLRPVPEAG